MAPFRAAGCKETCQTDRQTDRRWRYRYLEDAYIGKARRRENRLHLAFSQVKASCTITKREHKLLLH